MPSRSSRLFALLALCVLSASVLQAESEWPRWRGPHQNGHSLETDLPVEWGPESVVWRTPLEGAGQSSPVIFGERIFLTTALDRGRQRVVMCYDRNDGRQLWSDVAWTGEPEPTHEMNGWASATCTTDGERVYAFFGRGGGLFCYSVEGKKLWQKELGQFEGPWGTAAAPILSGELVIQNCDADENAYLIAFDKVTGEEVWKTERENARGWSTPILIEANGRTEMVLNGHSGVRAYDPQTGKELWFCQGFTGRGAPTATPAGDLLHIVCGLRGDTYAVRPGGNGNVTATHRVWNSPRNTARDLPSPIVIDQTTMVMDMRRATLTAYDIQTGKELWRRRVGEASNLGQFCATPVSWNGLAFFTGELGKTLVIRTGEDMEIVATNTVNSEDGELFRASITPSEGQLFLRSDKALYCVGKRQK
jgi:outer membrane protein assembly factor BamB